MTKAKGINDFDLPRLVDYSINMIQTNISATSCVIFQRLCFDCVSFFPLPPSGYHFNKKDDDSQSLTYHKVNKGVVEMG